MENIGMRQVRREYKKDRNDKDSSMEIYEIQNT